VREPPKRHVANRHRSAIGGDQSAKFQKPAPDRVVRPVDATFSQQILDIAEQACETSIEPNRVLDDLGRKTMSLEG